MHRKGLVSDIVTRTAVAAALLLTLPFSGIAGAEAPSGDLPSVSLKLYFFQDYSTYDSLFMENGRRLDEFVRQYGLTDPDGPRISVAGSASAEGPYIHNEELSLKRVARICGILEDSYGIPSYRIDREARGIDWDDLLQQVRTASGLSQREKRQVTDIITSVPEHTFGADGKLTDSRRKRLMDLNGGRTWTWMLDSIFYEQRYGMVTVSEPAGTAPALRDTVYVREDHYYYYHDTVHQYGPVVYGTPEGPATSGASGSYRTRTKKVPGYHFAVKTNLLFDLTTALNVELEFPIRNKVSLMLEHNFPWWLPVFGDKHYAMELLRTGIEARYWFGDRKAAPILTGWFVGAYGSADYYDIEWDNRGWQGETFLDFGVSGGYSFRIAENWRIETSLGLGYFRSNYTEYDHRLDVGLLVYQKDDTFTWIGPTKLKCSISWIIPNYPTEKSRTRKAAREQKRIDNRNGK